MIFFDKILAYAVFVCACFAVVLAPWFFGAWEMWWFWAFAILIGVGVFFFSLRVFVYWFMLGKQERFDRESFNISSSVIVLLSALMVFMCYATVRFFMADVRMDAERSFLLFLTPLLLGLQIVFSFSKAQRQLMYAFILVDIFLLGLYGIVNYLVWDNTHVLWVKGEAQYQLGVLRATGSYFCPNHFAGIMEIALCLSLGLILDKKAVKAWKFFGAILSGVSILGVALSKSRGGGVSVLVIFMVVAVFGFCQRRAAIRWYLGFVTGLVLFIGVLLFSHIYPAYTSRFISYFGWQSSDKKPVKEKIVVVLHKLRGTSRGNMIAGAIRAWKSNPVWGIGPGMHQNLWPHYSTSGDGDRINGKWPTYKYSSYYSYEAHSDWVQFLEEYGVAGVMLFFIPLCMVLVILFKGRSKAFGVAMGGVLVCICMSFHSLGDFNLQMPATVWMLASIVAIAISQTEDIGEPMSLSWIPDV